MGTEFKCLDIKYSSPFVDVNIVSETGKTFNSKQHTRGFGSVRFYRTAIYSVHKKNGDWMVSSSEKKTWMEQDWSGPSLE